MSKKSRLEIAQEKRAFVRKLFEEKPERSSNEVEAAVKEQFGSSISTDGALAIMHEVRGTKPRKYARAKSKRKVARKKAAKKATAKKKAAKAKGSPKAKTNGLVPLPITVQTQSSVEVLVKALVRAMRDEGVESITIRADGRGRAFQLVERDLNVGV